MVVALGFLVVRLKGIPCSLIAVFMNKEIAVDIFMPSSLQRLLNYFFTSGSMRTVTFVVDIVIPPFAFIITCIAWQIEYKTLYLSHKSLDMLNSGDELYK